MEHHFERDFENARLLQLRAQTKRYLAEDKKTTERKESRKTRMLSLYLFIRSKIFACLLTADRKR